MGNMIGSGVFLLPASLAAFGGLAIVGWLISAGGSLCLAFVFARLSRTDPAPGGPYAFTRRAFGDLSGFLVAWGYWISAWSTNAALAVATDSTRVATLMLANEGSNRAYPQLGVPEGHHEISHHGNEPEKRAKVAAIDLYHAGLFAHVIAERRVEDHAVAEQDLAAAAVRGDRHEPRSLAARTGPDAPRLDVVVRLQPQVVGRHRPARVLVEQ